ncbi:MAG: hypothetical protein R6X15_06405 [Pseudomonadota bacterium]
MSTQLKDTATGGSALQRAMETLTAQWYNAVVGQAGFDRNTFQLVQGSQVIGSTTEKLWQFFDTVPPLTVTNYYNPTSFNSFSKDYGGVIINLIPQGGDELQQKMGDYYSQWLDYAKKNADYSIKAFQQWAMGVDPSNAPDWISLYRTLFDGAIFQAQQAWDNMLHASTNPGVCAYAKTISDLNNALISSKSVSIHMDSSTESSNITNTWTEGEIAGFFESFFGGGESSYSSLSEKLATSSLEIDATFSNLVTFPASPLSSPSQDSILSKYTPWYSSEALNIAYKNNNNRVWKHGAPTWEGTFGANGDMTRMCGALIVVDGIDISITSSASFSSDEQQHFEAAAGAGFFPFFEAEAAHGWSSHTTFNDKGNATMTAKSPTGNPQVLGVIVSPIAEVLG